MIDRLRLCFAAVVALATQACQLAPYHGQEYESRSSNIAFIACTNRRDEPIDIQVCESPTCPSNGGTRLATFRTGTEIAYTDNTGAEWYCGSLERTIPSTYWRQTKSRWRTQVRLYATQSNPYGTGGGIILGSFENPPAECPAAWGMEARLSTDPKCMQAYTPPGYWNVIYARN